MPGARAVSFIDDITVILPPELSLDMAATGKVTEWLQERLGVEGISLNRRKSQALLADRVGPEQLTEEQRVAMDTTGAHGGPTGDEGCGSTSWNRTVSARFLTGGG